MRAGSRVFRLLEITTVGFPFCAFKFLTGSVFVAMVEWRALGWALIGLGFVDLALNAANFCLASVGRESRLPACTAQWLVIRLRPARESWRQLGLSVDAMLSFTLVAAMIGLGLLMRLRPADLGIWNVSVVFNVLGAGLGRLAETVIGLRADRAQET